MIWQVMPVKLEGQLHENDEPLLETQVPPFKQGLGKHGEITV